MVAVSEEAGNGLSSWASKGATRGRTPTALTPSLFPKTQGQAGWSWEEGPRLPRGL